MKRRDFLGGAWSFIALGWLASRAGAQAPSPMLAQVYHAGDPIRIEDWWISEKYDGVRAGWDGEQLWTRNGSAIHAPAWFTAGLPRRVLDGELWAGRGRFERASAVVRNDSDDDQAWRELRYLIFDLPTEPGRFDQRLAVLRSLQLPAQARAVEQIKLASVAALQAHLDEVVAAGGEGLMLHRGDSLYAGERSADLLKFKPYDDAEATVIGYVPGKNRLEGLMGALEVQTADGRRFRIGGGFSDEQRRHPPAIGSRITYAYNGLTRNGLPRFARFLRVRSDGS